MEKSNNYYTPVFIGIVGIIAGAVLAAFNGVLGVVLILVGAALLCSPLFKGRGPKVGFDGETLHITGAFANWDVTVKDIAEVKTVDSIKIVVMTMGYGGHRYIGGEFVENSLGGIYIAADKKIPRYIVVDTGEKRYVFNQTDLQTNDSLFDRISAALAGD